MADQYANAGMAQVPIASSASVVTDPVARVSDRQQHLELKRELCRALMVGTDAMRAAGEKWLPRHAAEAYESYQHRLKATILYGGFSQTVVKQAGKLFFREVVVAEDVPDLLLELTDDVDGQGRALSSFMYDVTKDGFVDGVSYVLVDFPRLVGAATLADQQAVKARPYWSHIPACNILGWKTEQVNGKTVLVQVRIRECVTVADGEYGEKEQRRVRVLSPGHYDVFIEKTRTDGFKYYEFDPNLSGVTSWTDITLVPVYTNQTGFFEGLPPLRELSELNQEHWISSSEQRHALTFLRFAMLCITGVAVGDKVEIGPDKVIKLTNSQGKASYVEHSGKGIEAGQQDLKDIEERMHHAGMELRIENQGRITATAAAIDSADSNAALKAIAKGVEGAIEQLLGFSAMMLGMSVEDGGSVEVYDEFAQETPPADSQELLNLHTAGLLSRETVWKELQRRHVLDTNFDATTEAAAIANEAPTLQGQPMPLGPGGNKPPTDSQAG